MRPESGYETRARELASAAGLDPEARIPNPAKPGKTMPAWCTFRDAARAEHLAAQNAEVRPSCRRSGRSSRTAR